MDRTVKLGIVLYGTIMFIVLLRLALLFIDVNPYSYFPFFLLLLIALSITGRYLKLQKELIGYREEAVRSMERKNRFRRVP